MLCNYLIKYKQNNIEVTLIVLYCFWGEFDYVSLSNFS